MVMIADVVADISAVHLNNRYFSYVVPPGMEGQVTGGCRVLIPFGGREVEGFVVSLREGEESGLKSLLKVLDNTPPLTTELLELGIWMAERTVSPVGTCLKTMIPRLLKRPRGRTLMWSGDPVDAVALSEAFPDLASLVAELLEQGEVPVSRALKMTTPEQIRLLEEAGLVVKTGTYEARPQVSRVFVANEKKAEEVKARCRKAPRQAEVFAWVLERGPVEDSALRRQFPGVDLKSMVAKEWLISQATESKGDATAPVLTGDQGRALAVIGEGPGEYLLFGVTGSGKTEIYLRLIENACARGRDTIVLVPEIGLTEHLVDVFRQRLGSSLAVWHSRMSDSERFKVWQDLGEGRARVVLGPRSAIFAPVKNLGLVIIDEEQEATYKQEETPRYHAAEIARWRAQRNNALLVYGSATPRLEIFYRALRGEIGLATLTKRIGDRSLPEATVVDMRAELKAGNRSMFSRRLQTEIGDCLAQGEQAIIFINRRGFARFVMCRSCGYRVDCPSCSVAMTYHQETHSMVCHYCGTTAAYPQVCPRCGSHYIRYFGVGTERVVEELGKLFPQARIGRMDMDSTRGIGGHKRVIEAVKNHELDILVGTQMLAKGFDFPDISLVGVLAADTLLSLPDFRAAERAMQLLTQVAGRSGRGDSPGTVIIQTYDPEHHVLKYAVDHDYQGFSEAEMKERQLLGYPPFSHLVRIVVWSKDEAAARQGADDVRATVQDYLEETGAAGVEILGPAPCPIRRIREQYRYGLLLKAAELDLLLPVAQNIIREMRHLTGRVEIDVEPVLLL